MEAFAAGPIAGIGRSFELQSSSLAKEKDCTNMVQVVLLHTKANILKYSNNRETIITTTNYTPKRLVDRTAPPSGHAGKWGDPGAKGSRLSLQL